MLFFVDILIFISISIIITTTIVVFVFCTVFFIYYSPSFLLKLLLEFSISWGIDK